MSKDPAINAALVVHFNDTTTKQIDEPLREIGRTRRVVNIGCTDISKSRVDAAFTKVFGYSASIDPATYIGRAVRKSEWNGVHDGQILDCPTTPDEGYLYQKLIESEVIEGCCTEYRVHVFFDQIPMVYLKLRPEATRFARFTARTTIVETADAMSSDEAAKIIATCRDMGVDYAELDVKRDRGDGRLYVLDVNDTPSGIVPSWGKHYDAALRRLSAALKEIVEAESAGC